MHDLNFKQSAVTKTTDGATGVANVRSGTFQRCRNVNWYNKATAAYFEREFNLATACSACSFPSHVKATPAGPALCCHRLFALHVYVFFNRVFTVCFIMVSVMTR